MPPATTETAGFAAALSPVADVRDLVEDYFAVRTVAIESPDGRDRVPMLILPAKLQALEVKKFFDSWRVRPERRAGTATLTDFDSFVEHVVRFKDDDSVIFACDDREKPSLTAVLDYHRAGADGEPRFGKHRAHYECPLSDEWKAWHKSQGSPMSPGEFAEFLEDRINDVLLPPDPAAPDAVMSAAYKRTMLLGLTMATPQRLMELSRGLQVHASEKVKQAIKTQTGEVQVHYASEHRDAEGKPISVPGMFLIGIPVFHHGARYEIAVQLRYRLVPGSGSIVWIYKLHRSDLVFDDAFAELRAKAGEATGLPVLAGRDEGAAA